MPLLIFTVASQSGRNPKPSTPHPMIPRNIYDRVDKLIADRVRDDNIYLPLATSYLDAAKRYERPSKVASSLIRAAKSAPKDENATAAKGKAKKRKTAEGA